MINKKPNITFFQKTKHFFKKHGYAFTVAVCVVAVMSALAISAVLQNSKIDEDYVEPPHENIVVPHEAEAASTESPIVFACPVETYTLGEMFSIDKLVYNATLNEWATHSGVDFLTEGQVAVMAALAGTVSDISYSALDGTVITITHDGGLKTIYKSLSNETEVEVGQTVAAGQVIGETSDSAGSEAALGCHLHFELLENDVEVDPSEYLFAK